MLEDAIKWEYFDVAKEKFGERELCEMIGDAIWDFAQAFTDDEKKMTLLDLSYALHQEAANHDISH